MWMGATCLWIYLSFVIFNVSIEEQSFHRSWNTFVLFCEFNQTFYQSLTLIENVETLEFPNTISNDSPAFIVA